MTEQVIRKCDNCNNNINQNSFPYLDSITLKYHTLTPKDKHFCHSECLKKWVLENYKD